MAEELIDHYILRSEIVKDTDFLLSEFKRGEKGYNAFLDKINKVNAAVNSGNQAKTAIDNSKTTSAAAAASVQGVKANAALAESTKAVTRLINERFASEAKLKTIQTDFFVQTQKNKLAIAEQTKEMKLQAAVDLAANGSREKAIALRAKMYAEQGKLNQGIKEEADRSQVLIGRIDKLNEFIKKNSDALSKQKINIGNYSGAVKTLEAGLADVRKKMDDYNKSGNTNTTILQALTKEEALLNQLVNSQAAGFTNATAEIRENQKALLQMEQAGLSGSKAFAELSLKTGKLKDDVADLRTRTKALGSDTFVFDGMIQGAQTLAGVYGIAQGAAALFGEENEELQKTFVKLQAIQTVLHGLQSVANALQKESAFLLVLSTARTKALAAAQTLYAFATGGATVATKALRVALLATGIGAILVLISSAASAMGFFSDKTEDAVTSVDDLSAALDNLNEKVDQSIKDINTSSKLQIEFAKQRGATEKEISKIVSDTYISEAENYKKLANGKLAINKGVLKANGIILQSTADAQRALDDLNIRKLAGNFKGTENIEVFETLLKSIITDVKKAEEAIDAATLNTASSNTAEIERQRGNAKKSGDDRKKEAEERLQRTKEYAEKESAARFAIIKLDKEREIELLKQLSEDEDSPEGARLAALTQYILKKNQLLEAEAAFEISTGKKTSSEIDLITAQKNDAQIKLAEEGGRTLSSIRAKYAKVEIKVNESIVDSYNETYDKLSKALDKWREQQAKALEEEKANGEKRKELAKQLAEELGGLAFDLLGGNIEREKNEIQGQIDLLDIKKAKEIEVANQSILNVQERAAAIAIIEARANNERERLERRTRELNIQKAKFDRAESIANIIARTAEAVVKMLASTAPPANLVLAALVGAIGAAQIARVLATPIPKYAHGKKDSYEGLAIVGDNNKKEAIIREDGRIEITPNRPTMTYVAARDIVIPSEKELYAMQLQMANNKIAKTIAGYENRNNPQQHSNKDVVNEIKTLGRIIKNKKEIHQTIESPLRNWIRSGYSWTEFINR